MGGGVDFFYLSWCSARGEKPSLSDMLCTLSTFYPTQTLALTPYAA